MVVWEADGKDFAADPIATTDLAYADWQALGARFVDLEDAIGGVSRLAAGRLGSEGRGFAVLDHDEDVTYLLADPVDAPDVLSALEALGVGSGHVLERLSPEPPAAESSAADRDLQERRYAKAISHPVRAKILDILQTRSASPQELAQMVDVTLGAAAYHVRRLHRLGLVDLVDEKPQAGAIDYYYRAEPRAEGGGRRGDATAQLVQAAEIARRAAAGGGFDTGHARLEHQSLALDARGVEELADAVGRLVDAAKRIQTSAAERLGQSGGEPIETALVSMVFDVGDPADAERAPRAVRDSRRRAS